MSTETRPGSGSGTNTHGMLFWVGLALGGALMVYGLVGLIRNIEGELLNWAVFYVGIDVVHDSILAPVTFAVGALVARMLPAPWRAPVTAGCVISAAVLLVVAVPLLGLGGNPGNPTLRPLDYPTATAWALAIVWGTVGIVSVIVAWSRR
ncbi:MAG: hypothetical protein M5U31_07965 [Acidimicrobiia bacterium]|nr:hypothetical protein [Acidimicrobiia bacterium]